MGKYIANIWTEIGYTWTRSGLVIVKESDMTF